MSDAKEREALEAELAKVDKRLREIEQVESELLDNIRMQDFELQATRHDYAAKKKCCMIRRAN